ncbi:MAG: hypothetical protein E7658_07680 [Ruminococcaceae bacterium]|nr:hypothetical protein [Oscillospiraceae bacterium]
MLKGYISKALYCFLWMFACLWVNLLISGPVTLAARFIFEKGSMEEHIVMMSFMTIAMLAGLFLCARRYGYTNKTFCIKMAIIPLVIAFVLHFLYALLFRFAIYTTGPAYELGSIISIVSGTDTTLGVAREYVIVPMLLYDILYAAVIIAGEYSGVKKRDRDREKLLSERKA